MLYQCSVLSPSIDSANETTPGRDVIPLRKNAALRSNSRTVELEQKKAKKEWEAQNKLYTVARAKKAQS